MRWIPLLICLLAAPCFGDILHLRDGSRYRGTLIRETQSEVVFRVMADARTGIVRSFPRERVERIERGAGEDTDSGERERAEAGEDFEQIYREAVELFSDGDLRAALLALQRLVNRAGDETLAAIDAEVRVQRGESLAALMARLRMEQALDDEQGLFRLRYASRYEAPALAMRLARLHDGLLEKHYHERSLRAWMADPEGYATLQPDAHEMVRDLRILAGVLGSRLKVDRGLRDDVAARTALAGLRSEASRLITRIETMPGYTNLRQRPTAGDPTLRAARDLATSRPADSEERPDGQDEASDEPAENERAERPVPDRPAEPDEPR